MRLVDYFARSSHLAAVNLWCHDVQSLFTENHSGAEIQRFMEHPFTGGIWISSLHPPTPHSFTLHQKLVLFLMHPGRGWGGCWWWRILEAQGGENDTNTTNRSAFTAGEDVDVEEHNLQPSDVSPSSSLCKRIKRVMKSGSVCLYLARCPCWCALRAWGARSGRWWWAGSVCGGRSRASRRPPSPAAGWTPCWKLFGCDDVIKKNHSSAAVNVLWRVLIKANKRVYAFLSVASTEMFNWAEGFFYFYLFLFVLRMKNKPWLQH